jgi:methyl-accepting chemotaxis protein
LASQRRCADYRNGPDAQGHQYRQSDAASSIAAAVEQLVASVNEIACSAQQASQAVEASHGLLSEASLRMGESQAASQNVVIDGQWCRQTMAELFQSISAIDRVSQSDSRHCRSDQSARPECRH